MFNKYKAVKIVKKYTEWAVTLIHNDFFELSFISASCQIFDEMGKISKVVVCGMKGVGKTAVLEQVIYGHISEKSVRFVQVLLECHV